MKKGNMKYRKVQYDEKLEELQDGEKMKEVASLHVCRSFYGPNVLPRGLIVNPTANTRAEEDGASISSSPPAAEEAEEGPEQQQLVQKLVQQHLMEELQVDLHPPQSHFGVEDHPNL